MKSEYWEGNMSLPTTRIFRSHQVAVMTLTAAGIASLSGCDGVTVGAPDPYLAIDYVIRTEPHPETLTNDVTSGLTTVGQLVGPSRCEFEADFGSGLTVPDIDLAGAPGQTGATVTITAANPTPRSAPTSECRALRDIAILIGGLNTPLSLGVPIAKSSASLIANGPGLPTNATFSSDLPGGFFSAELSNLNASTQYYTGEFEFIAPGPNGFVFIATGKYGST
jgi:hypothetical protein